MTVTIETIEAAARRLQGVVIETPLLSNHYLNDKLNAKVYIKPECLQHIGAFKFRGAYNRLIQLSDEQRKLFTADPSRWIGQVFKATGHGWFPSGSIRHPKYSYFRDDKSMMECTYDQIPESHRYES